MDVLVAPAQRDLVVGARRRVVLQLKGKVAYTIKAGLRLSWDNLALWVLELHSNWTIWIEIMQINGKRKSGIRPKVIMI